VRNPQPNRFLGLVGAAALGLLAGGSRPAAGQAAAPPQPAAAKLLPAVTIHPTQVTAWRVLALDADGDGREELLYAGYAGGLFCQDAASNEVLWRTSVGGFPFCLKSADLDSDGAGEILVSSSSLDVYALTRSGGLLWKWRAPFPILSLDLATGGQAPPRIVAAGNGPDVFVLDPGGAVLTRNANSDSRSVVTVLAGNLAGDAAPEMLAMEQYGRFVVRSVPDADGCWKGGGYSRALRWGKSVALWNVDDDARAEVLYTRSRRQFAQSAFSYELNLSAIDDGGARIWEKNVPWGGGVSLIYADADAALIDCTGNGTNDAAVLLGSALCVVDRAGNVLYKGCCTKGMSFTHMAGAPRRDRLVLGSLVGCSDRSVYVLRFAERAADEFARLTPDHGSHRQLMRNLRQIHGRVLALPAAAGPAKRQYRITVSGRGIITNERLRELFPYNNVTFLGAYGGGKPAPEVAERFVAGDVKHAAMVSHGLKRGNRATHWPSLEKGELTEFFEMTGGRCVGISFAETSAFMMPIHEQTSQEYLREFMLPCMDLAVQHGKDIWLWEKQAWWAVIPARRIFREVFDARFQPRLIARTEESNSRCPELNLMARVGLYRTGIVREWGCNVIRDLWRSLSTFILEYDYSDPSGVLRQLVAYAAAGATDFRLQYEFGAADADGVYQLDARRDLDLVLETFVHLLGKGLLVAPRPEEITGLAPVVIRMHEPHQGMLRNTNGNVEDFAPNAEALNGLLSGYWWWAFRPVHPAYLASYALNVKTYGHDFVPETPYGLPVVVPHWTPEERLAWASRIIDTDGVHVLENGRKLTAAARKDEILKAFQEGAEGQLFRAQGLYCMARRQGENSYRVTLVDPGVFAPAPADRDVDLVIQPGRKPTRIVDVLTGETLTPSDSNAVRLRVPAGAFRLMDVEF